MDVDAMMMDGLSPETRRILVDGLIHCAKRLEGE
jgi:hypothetical protein